VFRYFVIAWNASDVAQSCAAHALVAHLARRREWARALNWRGLAAFTTGARPSSSDVVLLRTHDGADASTAAGAIFGTLFGRNSPDSCLRGRLRTLATPDCRAIVASGGERLIESWWGRYVAVMRDPEGAARILRDPSGTLPCFRMQLRGLQLFFSDVEDCVALEQVPLSVDWNHVAAFVSGRFAAHSPETGLAQVDEVEPGECVELREGVVVRSLLWNPALVARRDVIEDGDAACRALLQTTRECVSAWASCYGGIVHSLSGGLDSSIVLACLSEQRPRLAITCLHHFGSGPDEDERRFARLAAGHFAIDLRERRLLAEATDLRAILGVRRSPRLSSYIGSLQRQPLQVRLASETQAQAIFTGAGGDGLFFQARAELAVTDYRRIRGVRPALASVALDAALVSRRSVWPLLAAALRADAREECARSLWSQSADDAVPGKRWQIASLARAPSFQDPLGHAGDPERTHPLLSQPLIELCLRIPTYVSIQGGWDRAIARRAFSSSLPADIVRRRAKGSITQFSTALLDRNLPLVRELLLDGVLVRERILDRTQLEQSLAGNDSLAVNPEILHTHLSAEAWARRWCR
jgi:asparagine synthase (glutamine-hydrolysing)